MSTRGHGWRSRPTRRGTCTCARLTWLEANQRYDGALAQLALAGSPDALAAFLDAHGPVLVLAGSTRTVTEAAATLPDELRTPRLERACGEAYMVRGDWRAPRPRSRGPPAAQTASTRSPPGAWASSTACAAPTTRRSRSMRGPSSPASDPAEEALLFAWIASAHYHRGDVQESEEAAERSLELAVRSGDARALSAAHTAQGMGAELAHDFHGASQAFDRALELAEVGRRCAPGGPDPERPRRARDRPGRRPGGVPHPRPRRPPRRHGRLRVVPRPGPRQSRTRSPGPRTVRGGARRLHRRARDLRPCRLAVGRLPARPRGQRSICSAATRYSRGSRSRRRSAPPVRRPDAEALAPALVGLAQTIVADDPERARELAAESVELGRDVAPLTVLLGAARVHVTLGERTPPATSPARRPTSRRPARTSRATRLGPRDPGPDDVGIRARPSCCASAAAEVWTAANIPYGYARNRLILASILDGDRARAAAEDAAGVFRSLGARGPATEATERLETLDRAGRPALEIGALGRFRVLRDGEPIPPTAWQSKKARDLLKILVSRRGRPTTRETLFEHPVAGRGP